MQRDSNLDSGSQTPPDSEQNPNSNGDELDDQDEEYNLLLQELKSVDQEIERVKAM